MLSDFCNMLNKDVIIYCTEIQSRTLIILGRKLTLPKTCGRVLDTTFDAMCAQVCVCVDMSVCVCVRGGGGRLCKPTLPVT